MKGKKFRIYGVQIPRKCIESRHVYSYSSPPIQTLSQVLIVTPQEEGNYLFF